MNTELKTKAVKVHVCNACGKNEDEVKKILLLPNYTLCSECIALASQLIEEDEDGHISTLRWLMRLGIEPNEIRKVVRK